MRNCATPVPAMASTPLRVYGVVCRQCACFVYPRTKHDVRRCPSGHVAVSKRPDGSVDFHPVPGCSVPDENFSHASGVIYAQPEALHNDWNQRLDRYGIIPAPAYRDFCVSIDR